MSSGPTGLVFASQTNVNTDDEVLIAGRRDYFEPRGITWGGSRVWRYQSVSDIQDKDHSLAEYFSRGVYRRPAHSH